MKRTLITLIAVLTFLCGTQAQETITKMVVKKVDNTQITLAVDDVDEITFIEEEVTAHEYVDLGLPSGTLWATCNVGANSPEEYGDYFAWGETEVYDWTTNYKWAEGASDQLTKYCDDSNYGYNGFTDDKTELDLEDDAAYVNWGTGWRMPSSEQIEELINKCTWTWTTLNGINGYEVEGPNGNSIFLPAAGYRAGDSLYDDGSWANYWSRSLYSSKPTCAYELNFSSGRVNRDYTSRDYGESVRAVRR